MTHAKSNFNQLMLTLIFGIRASEPPPPPPGSGERLKRPGLIGLKVQAGSLGTPLIISRTFKANQIKLYTVIVLLIRPSEYNKNFRNLTYDVTMMSLLKTMGKF